MFMHHIEDMREIPFGLQTAFSLRWFAQKRNTPLKAYLVESIGLSCTFEMIFES